jgi:hypothetical protein
METYVEAKSLIGNPSFNKHRKIALSELNFDAIDKPIVEIIQKITSMLV